MGGSVKASKSVDSSGLYMNRRSFIMGLPGLGGDEAACQITTVGDRMARTGDRQQGELAVKGGCWVAGQSLEVEIPLILTTAVSR